MGPFHVEALRDTVCIPSSPLRGSCHQCCVSPSEAEMRSRHPADHHWRVVWAGNTNSNNKNNWCFKHRSESEEVALGYIFYFCMCNLSQNMLSDSFVVFLWSGPSHYVQKQTTLVPPPRPPQNQGGDRTGAAVAKSLLLENKGI